MMKSGKYGVIMDTLFQSKFPKYCPSFNPKALEEVPLDWRQKLTPLVRQENKFVVKINQLSISPLYLT